MKKKIQRTDWKRKYEEMCKAYDKKDDAFLNAINGWDKDLDKLNYVLKEWNYSMKMTIIQFGFILAAGVTLGILLAINIFHIQI